MIFLKITGRNLRYRRAVEVIQTQEYLDEATFTGTEVYRFKREAIEFYQNEFYHKKLPKRKKRQITLYNGPFLSLDPSNFGTILTNSDSGSFTILRFQ